MCKAFSCIVRRNGEVIWQFGVDSHSTLVEKFNLGDSPTGRADDLPYANVEITPDNDDYLNPDKWNLRVDESVTPTWWTTEDEKTAHAQHKKWLLKLNRILVKQEIINPFSLKPPGEITDKHLKILKEWASVWASVWDSVWDSVWAYTGSFFKLPRKSWKHTDKLPPTPAYPFESAAKLWHLGLVPSFDGKLWRLHAGPKAAIVWEGTL